MNNFPKNLKHLRTKKGLNQVDMESWLGIGRSTWSNYENGVTNPSVEDIINFSKFFGVTLDELIVHDLNAKGPLPKKSLRQNRLLRKKVVYATKNTVAYAAEKEMKSVMKELKKLREEVEYMKEFKKRKAR